MDRKLLDELTEAERDIAIRILECVLIKEKTFVPHTEAEFKVLRILEAREA